MIVNLLSITNECKLDVEVPHIHEYFGVWAIQEDPFLAAVNQLNGMNLEQHVIVQQAQPRESPAKAPAQTAGTIAILQMSGPLMKYVSSLTGGTSTVAARRQLREAAQNPNISAIVLRIDSPGGTVSGTFDLVDDVRRASASKPVYAYIEDLGASAAYAIASAATKIYANPTALVGSIGTFTVIQDLSGRAAQLGVKVHVIRAGTYKGAGAPGTEVTPAHLAEWQRVVDQLNEHFIAAVSSGRRMTADATRALADGRVHLADAAKAMGLVDSVSSFDAMLNDLVQTVSKSPARAAAQEALPISRRDPMTTNEAKDSAAGANVVVTAELIVRPATSQELRQACPGADANFILSQLEANATVEQAKSAWIVKQQSQLTEMQGKLHQQQGQANRPGVETLPTTSSGKKAEEFSGDAVAEYASRVQEKIKAGATPATARIAVAKEDPALHQAYLLATNRGRKQQELIRDRFAMA